MFCHTGFTETYESLKEWNQDIELNDFDEKLIEKRYLGKEVLFLAIRFAKAVSQSNMFC